MAKKSFLVGSVAMALLLTACSKDTVTNLANISFRTTYQEDLSLPPEATAPTTTPQPLPVSLTVPFTYTFPTNTGQIAADNNTSRDKLVSVNVDSLYLEALAPGPLNLDFLDKIEVRVSAPSLPSVLAGQKTTVPKGQSKIVLDTEPVNLKNYFLQDSIHLEVRATFNALPGNGTKIRLGNSYKIVANPLK